MYLVRTIDDNAHKPEATTTCPNVIVLFISARLLRAIKISKFLVIGRSNEFHVNAMVKLLVELYKFGFLHLVKPKQRILKTGWELTFLTWIYLAVDPLDFRVPPLDLWTWVSDKNNYWHNIELFQLM